MFCKLSNKSVYWVFLVAVGLVSIAFGSVSHMSLPEDAHSLNMFMGMFTGMGAAFVAIGVIRLLHIRYSSPEKLKKEQIERFDERNVQILRIAYTFSAIASTVLFAVMAFLFVYLGYRVPAFISIGALYVQVLVFFISYNYYKRKM